MYVNSGTYGSGNGGVDSSGESGEWAVKEYDEMNGDGDGAVADDVVSDGVCCGSGSGG